MYMENPPALDELMQVQGVTKVDFLNERRLRVFFNGDREIAERLVTTSVQKGWRLVEINLEKTAIDEIFKQLSSQNNK